ncbi:hypothetical protein PC128_g4373 [Phytophthora cactorum]|nr:hypothetical protein PC128_g4373 [Phytophthora cactorum]
MKLYLKPSQHAKQAQFMVLASETWPGMLAEARANYHKQKKDVRWRIRRASAHVCCKRSTPRHSRTTPTRIAEAAEAIDSNLVER